MTVNIYNVTKSVVTLEKQTKMEKIVEMKQEVKVERDKQRERSVFGNPKQEVENVPVIFEKVKKRQVREVELKPNVAEKQVEVDKKQPEGAAIQPEDAENRQEVRFKFEKQPEALIKTAPEVKPQPIIIEPSEAPAPVEPKITVVKLERVTANEVTRQKIEDDQRPTSPSWTYTLPAPPVFADTGVVNSSDAQKNGGKFFSDFASTDCNETVLSDSNTTVISAETHIQPIIVQRKSLDDSFVLTSPAADNESDKSTEIITSDLEDGYLGNGKIVSLVESPAVSKIKKEIVIEDFKRSRLVITRSDSFHSIGQGRNFDAVAKRGPSSPQRSTSFLSLVQAQKAERIADRTDNAPYSRQKSNSELSICDSPSLQSLEVIRNILNSSRKNSLQDVVKAPPVVKKVEEVIVKQQEPEVKPAETQWRYSGPPKINLGTWSERPKVEVAIAADRDYKFGKIGVRDTKNEVTTSKRHTIHISNEREAEKHLPKVLGVEYKKDASPAPVAAQIVTKPTRTIINIKPRPMSMNASNSYSSLVTTPASVTYNHSPTFKTVPTSVTYNHSTLVTSPTSPSAPSSVSYNRLNTNAKKFTPVVRGFKLNNIKEADSQPEVVALPVVENKAPLVPEKPAFLRSTSAGDINRNVKLSTVEMKVDDDKPFSQITLRKTGLKDKILLSDKDTKSIFGRVVEPQEHIFMREADREDQVEKVAVRQLSMPMPPKPPTAPPPMNFRKSAPVDSDTRNQLLDAIKSFNRDALRHK